MILMGPPGTGKTLSARIMRNMADATFIWVSARDFWNAGSYGAFTHSFDLARELAPTVLCFEDVDSWMDRRGGTEDLLKSEMDGMGRSSGVLTLLTTNYPENIPDTLIDRPGRFHDVLLFDLPDRKTRGEMLAAWLPEAAETDRRKVVDRTDGYSGAHMYELCVYATTLQEETEALIGECLVKAVDKIEEQRELITGVQLEGSHYKPKREYVSSLKAFQFGNKTEGNVMETKGAFEAAGEAECEACHKTIAIPIKITVDDGELKQAMASAAEIKAGRALSKANESRIRDAHDDCEEIAKAEGVPRGAAALARSAAKHLVEVLASLSTDDEEKQAKQRSVPIDPKRAAAITKQAVSGAIQRARCLVTEKR